MPRAFSPWVAGLPLYDFPALRSAHDIWWTAIASRLRDRGMVGLPTRLSRDLPMTTLWRHSRLLLAQACEYPVALSHSEHLRVVAAPLYVAEGCDTDRYRSAIVVRVKDRANELADLRHRRCVVNERDSNSGMNLLRSAIAPLAAGPTFFESVRFSGAHLRSLELIAAGEADVAAIDCVSLALIRSWHPSLTRQVRVLAWTASTPSPPYVTSRQTDGRVVEALRAALLDVAADPHLAAVRSALLIGGMSLRQDDSYREVLALAHSSMQLGFRLIA